MIRVYARELGEHLPYLRRYARALTGSTEQGDALVTRCVEAAVMAPTRFGVPQGSRAPLYALLHVLFDGEGQGRPVPSTHPIEAALMRLPEIERRLYLLVALEELSLPEAAQVLDLPVEAAAELLAEAREQVRRELTARVLVVEDNAVVAVDLSEVIASMGHVVCGTAATEHEAMELVRAEHPTLALLDIRLAQGGSGLNIARRLRREFRMPVIFITAYAGDIPASEADELGPVIRKPFSPDAVRDAITRAVFAPSGSA